jgi:hypothetical protein
VLFMHGANENHLQNHVAFAATPSGEVIQPGHFDVPAIVAFALGRDPSWGTGPAEQDVLDVIGDVSRRFPIDRNRIVATGISAGGFGTFRMTELRPDLFAGGFSLVGADAGLPGNLYNTPIRMQNGLADPLVNPSSWLPTVQTFSERGDVDFRSFQNANRSHTHVPALGNCIYLELIDRGRVVNPARVLYDIDPSNEVNDPATGLVIAHSGAYWVSGMALRKTDVDGGINAASLNRSDRTRTGTTVTAPHNNALTGEDYCGPNPAVRTGDTWNERSVLITPGKAVTTNGLSATLRNLRSAALDLSRMSLSATQPITAAVTGDGVTSLRLVGAKGKYAVTRDGVLVGTVKAAGGGLTLDRDFSGTHTYVLTPAS